MKIRIISGDTTLTATLADNATAKDFASLLPLTLELKDYEETEKISDLPKRLSTAGAPAGSDPDVGDIAYYSPWGNLAIYYKDFGYSKGLIKLGRIDSGIETLCRPGQGHRRDTLLVAHACGGGGTYQWGHPGASFATRATCVDA